MADMPVARRMRRFRASSGTEYDETVDGQLRRRLNRDDPSPIPAPQTWAEVERKEGRLIEIDSAALERRALQDRQRRRGCADCSKKTCRGGCTAKRQKGQRRR